MMVIDESGLKSSFPFEKRRAAGRCIFELVYFARPDSRVFGQSVFEVRKNLGRQLAKESPIDADVVIAVPDSGVAAAMGFAEASGIRYDVGLIRSHYVGRTFIEPQQSIRHFGVKLKLAPVRVDAEGQAGGGGRRLHRARHHLAEDRQDAQGRGGEGGAPAHLQPADRVAVLLRHRHAQPAGADRRLPQHPRRSPATSPPTRWVTSRWPGSTRQRRIPRARATAPPASAEST